MTTLHDALSEIQDGHAVMPHYTLTLLLDVALAVDRWERGLCEHPDNAEVCGEWRQSNLGRALQLLEAHLCGGEDGA